MSTTEGLAAGAGGGLEAEIELEAGEDLIVNDNWFIGADGKKYKFRNEFNGTQNINSFYPGASTVYDLYLPGTLGVVAFMDKDVNKILWIGRSTLDASFGAGISTVDSSTGQITVNAFTDSGNTLNSSSLYFHKLSSNKVLVLSKSGTSLEGIIIDYSGSIPIFGSKATVNTTNLSGSLTATIYDLGYDPINNKIIFTFGENSNFFSIRAITATISGNNISWGSVEIVDFVGYTSNPTVGRLFFDNVEGKFILVYKSRNSNNAQIKTCSIDISGGSISVGSVLTLTSDGSAANTDFLDSANGTEFAKLGNGNYLACSYFNYSLGKWYASVLRVQSGGANILSTTVELRDGGSNISYSDATPLIAVGNNGEFIVGGKPSNSSTDYLYKLTFNGTTLSIDKLITNGNSNTIQHNLINTIDQIVLHNTKRESETLNTAQVFDFSINDEIQGYYDLEPMGVSLPYIRGYTGRNGQKDWIKSSNGVAILMDTSSYTPVLITDEGKSMPIIPLGTIKENVSSGNTSKDLVKLNKQGIKAQNFIASGLRPPSSYYLNGESLKWYASSNSDTSFNDEYIGYSPFDDNLIINSNNAKET